MVGVETNLLDAKDVGTLNLFVGSGANETTCNDKDNIVNVTNNKEYIIESII
eukprot:CAMPEP_0170062990 /NCGR_PEP_ID=MMETSP0019_2-20121128/4022_1 /TAXON_ID=98059 /ORGANISM="Dinobryon sp., Strain UTEXLB2267" /LENGTH=51 /DNA_ID=CAMNT_0010269301 /DNA_START=379 /DNA_END=534 /DNA_ORIENTATION=-